VDVSVFSLRFESRRAGALPPAPFLVLASGIRSSVGHNLARRGALPSAD